MNAETARQALEGAGWRVNPNWNSRQLIASALWLDPDHRRRMAAARDVGLARLKAGEGSMYVARVIGTDTIKIGHALDIAKRMKGLKSDYGADFELLGGFQVRLTVERRLHRLLRRHRDKGRIRGCATEFYHISVLGHDAIPEELRSALR